MRSLIARCDTVLVHQPTYETVLGDGQHCIQTDLRRLRFAHLWPKRIHAKDGLNVLVLFTVGMPDM